MSVALPWSIITFFTSYPPILSLTIRASSWGYMAPNLSSSEKPKIRGMSTLALFDAWQCSSIGGQNTDSTLEGQDPVLPRAAKIMFIVPKGSLEEAFPRSSEPAWNDVRVASTSLLRLTGPNGPINSCNPPLYVHDHDDSGNKGSGCIL